MVGEKIFEIEPGSFDADEARGWLRYAKENPGEKVEVQYRDDAGHLFTMQVFATQSLEEIRAHYNEAFGSVLFASQRLVGAR